MHASRDGQFVKTGRSRDLSRGQVAAGTIPRENPDAKSTCTNVPLGSQNREQNGTNDTHSLRGDIPPNRQPQFAQVDFSYDSITGAPEANSPLEPRCGCSLALVERLAIDRAL